MSTYGPGALVDLPDDAVIVSSIDNWHYDLNAIPIVDEPRLAAKLEKRFSPGRTPSLRLPPVQESEMAPKAGVRAFVFPNWFVVQNPLKAAGGVVRRRLVHRKQLEAKKYRDPDARTNLSVVPMRFVQACSKGHIDDIPWRAFVHQGQECGRQESLWVEESTTSGALSDIQIVCECGKRRRISDVYSGRSNLGTCTGVRPWMGSNTEHFREECRDDKGNPTKTRILLRSATNAHFPQILSVISIPEGVNELEELVATQWESLKIIPSREFLSLALQMPSLKPVFQGWMEDEIWQAIQSRKGGGTTTNDRPVKDVEIEAFLRATDHGIPHPSHPDFVVRKLPEDRWQRLKSTGLVDRIVLADRLREVAAMVGFTRLAPSSTEINGELTKDQVEMASISYSNAPDWFPVREIRGEGVFVQLSTAAVTAWLDRPGVLERAEVFRSAFETWKNRHKEGSIENPGLVYYLLHSLSHLLLTQISLECGYPASSLKERIYCTTQGHGILIYTGANDAEGTLGGLVQAGEDIERHLLNALQSAELCSGDPVCAHHRPDAGDDRPLQGAVCHGCLFIPETSCEQRNEFLDRSLVVATVEAAHAEFFQADHLRILEEGV